MMNKQQREWCEGELTRLHRRFDKLDYMMEKDELAGDMEKYAKHDHSQDLVLARMDGIMNVLHVLGYHARYNDDFDRFDVLNNDY